MEVAIVHPMVTGRQLRDTDLLLQDIDHLRVTDRAELL
jgi:hypothetical protein